MKTGVTATICGDSALFLEAWEAGDVVLVAKEAGP